MLGIRCPDRHALPRFTSSKTFPRRRALPPARAGSFFDPGRSPKRIGSFLESGHKHRSFGKQPREAHGESRMPNPKYTAYEPADPYFKLVRGALGDLVDGEHFFDIVADDVVYEVLYDFPGWPRIIQGRANLMDKFRDYVDNI